MRFLIPLGSGCLAFGIFPTALPLLPKVHARTVFVRIKQYWRQLRHAPPGERFKRRYQLRQRNGHESTLRRVLLVGLGVALACIGVVLMFIPGPAILFFFVAGAIFAEESRWVARALDALEVRLRRWWASLRNWWCRRSASGKSTVLATALLVAATSAYFTYRMFT